MPSMYWYLQTNNTNKMPQKMPFELLKTSFQVDLGKLQLKLHNPRTG